MRNTTSQNLADTLDALYRHFDGSLAEFMQQFPGSFDIREQEFFVVHEGEVAQCYYIGHWCCKF